MPNQIFYQRKYFLEDFPLETTTMNIKADNLSYELIILITATDPFGTDTCYL
jgi:hypothetical protein